MNLALNPAFWQTACYTKCEERALRYNYYISATPINKGNIYENS